MDGAEVKTKIYALIIPDTVWIPDKIARLFMDPAVQGPRDDVLVDFSGMTISSPKGENGARYV